MDLNGLVVGFGVCLVLSQVVLVWVSPDSESAT